MIAGAAAAAMLLLPRLQLWLLASAHACCCCRHLAAAAAARPARRGAQSSTQALISRYCSAVAAPIRIRGPRSAHLERAARWPKARFSHGAHRTRVWFVRSAKVRKQYERLLARVDRRARGRQVPGEARRAVLLPAVQFRAAVRPPPCTKASVRCSHLSNSFFQREGCPRAALGSGARAGVLMTAGRKCARSTTGPVSQGGRCRGSFVVGRLAPILTSSNPPLAAAVLPGNYRV